jgi:hypothetical protein
VVVAEFEEMAGYWEGSGDLGDAFDEGDICCG